MTTYNGSGSRLPPRPPDGVDDRVQAMKEFWTDLEMSGDSGCTTWDVLDPIKHKVTRCLMQNPPDLRHAESLTAEAMLRLNGQLAD